jgi:hypothetical protein
VDDWARADEYLVPPNRRVFNSGVITSWSEDFGATGSLAPTNIGVVIEADTELTELWCGSFGADELRRRQTLAPANCGADKMRRREILASFTLRRIPPGEKSCYWKHRNAMVINWDSLHSVICVVFHLSLSPQNHLLGNFPNKPLDKMVFLTVRLSFPSLCWEMFPVNFPANLETNK